MDQLLEKEIVTAPRETETPITPARRAARMAIQRNHLLKVQRDIKAAFSNQLSAKRLNLLLITDSYLNDSGCIARATCSRPSAILGEGRWMRSESRT
jgi:hypothetical protein